MAKSDARFAYRANLGRQEHNLDRPFGFTCAPGMLVPIFADACTAGDTYYIHHDLNFMRTAPLAAPAMIDVKVHYESFFVPAQMVYQPFENTMYSLRNFQSDMYTDPSLLNNAFPVFDLQGYVFDIYNLGASSNYHQLAFRFADYLGLNALGFVVDGFTPVDPSDPNNHNFTGTCLFQYYPSVFPWQALVYHTIFQYYYRLDDKSQFSQYNANVDSYYAGYPLTRSYNSDFYTIYQRPWDFDYFMSMYRSPILDVNNMQRLFGQESGPLSGSLTYPINESGQIAVNNNSAFSFSQNGSSSFSRETERQNASTAAIRQAFANEKLAMITGRARKNYDSQVLAHLGVSVPIDVKHDLQMIGQDTYKLHIGEVTSLASTTDAPLGELAGKGWASGQGKKHKFTAPCHGFIMTIFSVEPLRRYCGGFERQNAVTSAFDFPIPEYDRLGNVPMYSYETGLGNTPTNVIGWKERYYQWKRRSPKLTLAFMPDIGGSGVPPAVNAYASYFLSYFPFGRKTTNSSYPSLERSFYIERQAMNDIMLTPFVDGWLSLTGENWNTHPYLVYSRDPFIVDSYEKVLKVSWMSKDGEPIYPY